MGWRACVYGVGCGGRACVCVCVDGVDGWLCYSILMLYCSFITCVPHKSVSHAYHPV